jgi:glycogen(starch) synthase
MRCLMLCWEYPPVVEGGLGRHVGGLVPELIAAGVDVAVLTRGAGGKTEPGVHRVPEPRRPDHIGRFVAWVERMNDDMLAAGVGLGSFDLVHGHDWLVSRAAARLSRRLGVPLLMTIHATEHGRHGGWVAQQPQSHIHAVERRAVADAAHLITCSVYMRDHLVDVFGADGRAVSVIANGVDSAPAPVGSAERQVLLAGRLVYEKGFQLALAALPGLLDRVGPLRLVIAGAGIHEDALRALAAELGIERQVDFLGWVGPERLAELYAAADVCVVPSLYEPFGLVALEAMASGCPCVVADTGGLRELVGHGEVGLRFAAGDPASLAAMVELVLADRALRERLVAAGRSHAAGFTWAAAGARTAAVYRGLCAGAATPVALGSRQ